MAASLGRQDRAELVLSLAVLQDLRVLSVGKGLPVLAAQHWPGYRLPIGDDRSRRALAHVRTHNRVYLTEQRFHANFCLGLGHEHPLDETRFCVQIQLALVRLVEAGYRFKVEPRPDTKGVPS